jgi:hypothetical protein
MERFNCTSRFDHHAVVVRGCYGNFSPSASVVNWAPDPGACQPGALSDTCRMGAFAMGALGVNSALSMSR